MENRKKRERSRDWITHPKAPRIGHPGLPPSLPPSRTPARLDQQPCTRTRALDREGTAEVEAEAEAEETGGFGEPWRRRWAAPDASGKPLLAGWLWLGWRRKGRKEGRGKAGPPVALFILRGKAAFPRGRAPRRATPGGYVSRADGRTDGWIRGWMSTHPSTETHWRCPCGPAGPVWAVRSPLLLPCLSAHVSSRLPLCRQCHVFFLSSFPAGCSCVCLFVTVCTNDIITIEIRYVRVSFAPNQIPLI